MTREDVNHEISECLIRLFRGDADRIQAWLTSPNEYLDDIQPTVWWTGGKARELLDYLRRQEQRRAGKNFGGQHESRGV